MTTEMMIEEERNSTQMMKEKVDHMIEVRATDHQEFLINLHQTHIQEILMLDPNMLVDKVMTTDTKDSHREKDQDLEVIKTHKIIECMM